MSVSISSHSLRQWVSLLGGCSYSGVASHLMCKPANSLHSAAHSSYSVKALAAVVYGHTDICHCFDGHDVSWWRRLCESRQCFAFFWLIWFSFGSSSFLFFFILVFPLQASYASSSPSFVPLNYPLMAVFFVSGASVNLGIWYFWGPTWETIKPELTHKRNFQLTRTKLIFLVDYCGQT